jgi:ABC-type multidrug transport system ATPase subunit
MRQLGIHHVADQQIGSAAMGGITPDARKRVTIAVELVMDPKILFLVSAAE